MFRFVLVSFFIFCVIALSAQVSTRFYKFAQPVLVSSSKSISHPSIRRFDVHQQRFLTDAELLKFAEKNSTYTIQYQYDSLGYVDYFMIDTKQPMRKFVSSLDSFYQVGSPFIDFKERLSLKLDIGYDSLSLDSLLGNYSIITFENKDNFFNLERLENISNIVKVLPYEINNVLVIPDTLHSNMDKYLNKRYQIIVEANKLIGAKNIQQRPISFVVDPEGFLIGVFDVNNTNEIPRTIMNHAK